MNEHSKLERQFRVSSKLDEAIENENTERASFTRGSVGSPYRVYTMGLGLRGTKRGRRTNREWIKERERA